MTAGKRAYSSELRAGQARRTRRQIVLAAGELFAEHGYAATTIDAIAERAGVSRKTVFAVAGGKVALVKLAYDQAVTGDDEEIAMTDRPQIQALREMPDPARMIEAYASIVTTAMARVAPVYMAIRAAADADPQASEILRQILAERKRGMAEPAQLMHQRGQLRPGLSVDRARDLLWFYIDPAHYAQLVGDCGWPPADFATWIASSLKLHLLGRPLSATARHPALPGVPHPDRVNIVICALMRTIERPNEIRSMSKSEFSHFPPLDGRDCLA